ncbi:bacillithiol biosynthesis deacetylase BshB1 [Pedobacter sp. BS3]|uniref:bacillithiol biosynthesis deacetylase BshB1 n=1 Tax=Pedobacter sp. BS3 TaxID=2567937 RepID=UPI0011EE49E8|nr:bacillithiol biosynthesis deacetylase BshB1 [Pedobacter sp. BS3]TZF83805.1 bacillithiol biosynthesis deacetylase BshB1 [Pedobacter sp. BS3]
MKLDILVFAAHPDDAELGCSGTILKHVALGKKVGIIDLTRGELGSRGTAETRDVEAADSARILGLAVRENLWMRDAFFRNDEEHQLQVIRKIRQYQPDIVLCNALEDRHPDHGRGGDLVNDAVFLSGLTKIVTDDEGQPQQAWRPRLLLQFIQDRYIKPDIIVDVTDFWQQKVASIQAFKTQFYNPEYDEPTATYISSPEFMHIVEGRAREFGKNIGVTFGEGFTCRRQLGVSNLFELL